MGRKRPSSSPFHAKAAAAAAASKKKKAKANKTPPSSSTTTTTTTIKTNHAPEPEEEIEVNEEDRAFFEEHSSFASSFLSTDPLTAAGKGKQDKKRKLPPATDETTAATSALEPKSMRRKASTQGWDTNPASAFMKVKERLPTKTIDGKIHMRTEEVEDEEDEEEEAAATQAAVPPTPTPATDNDEEEEEDDEGEDYDDDDDDISVADSDASESAAITKNLRAAAAAAAAKKGQLSGNVSAAAKGLSLESFSGDVRAMRRARLELKKVEIATLCESLLEDPENGLMTRVAGTGSSSSSEGNEGKLKKNTRMTTLLSLLEDDDVKVQALAMASLLAVFKDIAPAYRIRVPTEKELQQKVSKEVKKTREYERTLLASYQVYLKHLEHASKKGARVIKKQNKKNNNNNKTTTTAATSTSDPSSTIAAKCLCELLTTLPHFNFTTNVLAAVVRLGLGIDPATRVIAAQAVRRLLERDQQGESSLTAARLICKEVKNRQLDTPDEMVRALQALRLRVKEDDAEEVLAKAKYEAKKRGGKHKKKYEDNHNDDEDEEGQGDILAGLKEAEARADPELRARCQAESLQEVTLLYFRVLKQAKKHTLLPAALEGLSRLAHLINIDTVMDLLDVLKELLNPERRLPLEASLHAVLTALRTLQGPGRELKVDDKAFLTFLYQQLGRASASASGKGHNNNNTALFSLLVTCLRHALLERREFSMARIAAFYKRLAALALQLTSPQEITIILSLIRELGTRYPGLEQLLDGEADRVAMGVYQPAALEPEMSNPLATGAWELTLLKTQHYHPKVKKAAGATMSAIAAAGAAAAAGGTGGGGRMRRADLRGLVVREGEDDDWVKHGFGGMFLRVPRQNPLHGMVRRAEREKRGARVKLYFIQKVAHPELLEGGGEAQRERLMQGVAEKKEGKGEEEDEMEVEEEEEEESFGDMWIDIQQRELLRSKALIQAYQHYREQQKTPQQGK